MTGGDLTLSEAMALQQFFPERLDALRALSADDRKHVFHAWEQAEGTQEQDALLREWPHGDRGAPVWHMDEPISRLERLTEEWPRVCIGSTAEFADVLSPSWDRRMDEAWTPIARRPGRTPWVHMLRGGQVRGLRWPFASTDSVNIGQNCHAGRPRNNPEDMKRRIEAANCPARFSGREHTAELFA